MHAMDKMSQIVGRTHTHSHTYIGERVNEWCVQCTILVSLCPDHGERIPWRDTRRLAGRQGKPSSTLLTHAGHRFVLTENKRILSWVGKQIHGLISLPAYLRLRVEEEEEKKEQEKQK